MKKLLSVLLATVMLLTGIPLGAIPVLAEESASEQPAAISEEEEYIYYSDLFYGYSYYLANAPYLLEHYLETQDVLDTVTNDFMDSTYTWSVLKDALEAATDLKQWVGLVSDAFGLTSFTYENALDAANEDFAANMIGESSLEKHYGANARLLEIIKDLAEVYDNFEATHQVDKMTEVEIFEAMFTVVGDSGILVEITQSSLTIIEEDVLPKTSAITKALGASASALTGAKTLTLGLVMEDFRLDLISDIIANVPADSMLYDGMTRLQKQLKNGFASYFLENYLKEETLKFLADQVIEKLSEAVLGPDVGIYKLVSSIVKVASWVVFDVIFNVPDIDDLTKQVVLTDYAFTLFELVQTKAELFNQPFTSATITNFESIATAYISATNAALSASDRIKASSNETQLEEVVGKYSKTGVYDHWIESAKEYALAIPYEFRTITDFGTWTITSSKQLLAPSDKISNQIHCLSSGLKTDILIDNYSSLTIPENTNVCVDGNISCYYHADLIINGKLHLSGNLHKRFPSSYSIEVENNGTLVVDGNIDISSSDNTITQTREDATIVLRGNWNSSSNGIKAGDIIFAGDQVQTIYGLNAYNIIVTNPAGVQYLSSITLRGRYELNGNPLLGGDYGTRINTGCSFDEVSDYKNLIVSENVILTDDVKANIHISNSSSLTIPENSEVRIEGNVIADDYVNLIVDGKLHLTGNLEKHFPTSYSVRIKNSGTLVVDGNIDISSEYNTITQAEEDATIVVRGNWKGASSSNALEAGTIVFAGDQVQMADGLNAYDLIITNTSETGVVFTKAVTVNHLFDHRGNNFTLYNNGSGSNFVDYDGDGTKDNVDPQPTIHNHTYDDEYDAYCNTCGVVRMDDILVGGQTSISEEVNGLAFKFDVAALGGQVVNGNHYVNGSALVTSSVEGREYKLVRMGAVASNKSNCVLDMESVDGKQTIDIEAVYLCDLEEDSLSYAVRIINIPENSKDTDIYARPYYVYEKHGEEIVVYGDTVSQSYNAVLGK